MERSEMKRIYPFSVNLFGMKRMKLLTFLAVLTVLLVLFAGCTQTGEEGKPAPEKARTYIVGIDGQYPPFSYVDSSGNATGFDVDSMRWIAEKKGLDVEFQPIAWDGIIPALQAKKIDLIYAGMTITDERKEKVNFSTPYWVVNQDVVAQKGSNLTVEDVLSGTAIIGTQRGCTAAMWIEENLIGKGLMPQANLKLYDNTPLAVNDLESGRIDAVMYDDLSLKDMIQGKDIEKIGSVETNEEFGIAVRKEDTDLLATLNEGLADLMKDPYWQELITKYNMK
jgi:polar amino acid transport system substrate-binding protein